MAAVEGSYRTLLQGMSQQPPQTRAEGQCELQVNMSADPVNDLRKRPASKFVSTLSLIGAPKKHKFYDYDRGDNEEYLIALGSSSITVTGQDGTSYPVEADNYTYLSTANPEGDLSISTVGDITVIANRQVITKMVTWSLTPSGSYATIDIKGGSWATSYTVVLDKIGGGVHTITYTTPSGVGRTTDADGNALFPIDPELDSSKLTPQSIAISLYLAIEAVVPGAMTYPTGSTIKVNTNIAVVSSTTDGRGGTFMTYAHDHIDSLDKLPLMAATNRIIRVTPDASEEAGDYYLKFVPDALGTGSVYTAGTWKECPAPGLQYWIDYITMPHALIRLQKADGSIYFRFTPLNGSVLTNYTGTYIVPTWKDRLVGDEDTNPLPSFIGKSITTVGLFQNRMYFLSGENIIFSTSDSYWDYFYTTALTVLDSDPMDFSAATGQVNVLKYGVLQDSDLILFSNNTQFVISGSKALTPSSASMAALTFFESGEKAQPLPSGRSVYFPITYGEYNGVRELQTDAVSATRDAPPISSHVSQLIKGNITKISSVNEAGIMLMSTDKYDNRLYSYEYIWEGNTKLQAAWSYWEYDVDYSVLYHFVNKNVLFVVVHNIATSQVFLMKHQMDDFLDTSFGFNIYLDNIVKIDNATTTVTIPFSHREMKLIQGDGCPYPGLVAGVYNNPTYTGESVVVTLPSDMNGGSVYVGIPYTAKFTPTRPYIKDSKGTPITTGALTIGRYILSYRETGYIQAVLTSKYGGEVEGLLTGRVTGEAENKVGVAPIISGSVNIPVLQSPDNVSVTVTSDDYRPIVLTDLEWDGQFSKNKKRI